MKPLAKLGYLAAACALLVATFSFIGPRAVKAAVATLVEVANTTAQPVPNLDMNTPGEESFQANLCINRTDFQCGAYNSTGTTTFTVPSTTADGRQVKRLIITQAQEFCAAASAFDGSQLITITGGDYGYFSPETVTYAIAFFNGPFFADPGTGLAVYANGSCRFLLTGYYLTQ